MILNPAAPKLFEIRLPEGDCPGLDIDVQGNTGQRKLWSKDWLLKGYDGVRIIGAGIGRTHMRPNWNGWTLNVLQHNGIVQLEALTLHAGRNAATLFGYENRAHERPHPKFQFRFYEAAGVVDPPHPEFGRSKWLLFLNRADSHVRDVTLDATLAHEHGSYNHGFASKGMLWERVHVLGSGSQGCKIRSDAIETVKPPGTQWAILRNCTFKNIGQGHGSRGPGAFVAEGIASNILLDKCVFWGGGVARGPYNPNDLSKAFMISSEPYSHMVDGKYGNGDVVIRDCAAFGHSEVDWNSTLVMCESNARPAIPAARSFLMERCGMWGQKMQVHLGDMPTGKAVIRGCNTPQIRDFCGKALGMNVTHEAVWPGPNRRVPLSEGVTL